MAYAIDVTARYAGQNVGKIFHAGQLVDFSIRGGQMIYAADAVGLPPMFHRIVQDDDGEWFEVGFLSAEPLTGNSAAGWTDAGQYARLHLEQSEDLVHWFLGKFTPCSPAEIANPDGTYTYWSRATTPLVWRYVMVDETLVSTRYGKSITELSLKNATIAIPGYPYAMPADAARLQADLRATGHPAAVVSTVAAAAITVEIKTHTWSGTGYDVITLQVSQTGNNVTEVRTSAGTPISLPGYPYAMPAAQAALQADLIAAGQAGAVVKLYGDSWTVFLPDLQTIMREREFHATITPGDPHGEWDIFGGYSVNPDATVQGTSGNIRPAGGGAVLYEAQKQFARLGVTPTKRYSPAMLAAESDAVTAAAVAGKPGGAASMNLWLPSAYDNTSAASTNAYHNARNEGSGVPYDRNPDFWLPASLMPSLTSVVIVKDDCGTSYAAAGQAWRARFGGVAITPRHVLYCAHAYTHAQSTWINGNTTGTPPTRLRWVGMDNLAVDRVQLHQARADSAASNPANDYGASPIDLCVAVIDEDLPAGIHIARITPMMTSGQLSALFRAAVCQEWQPAAAGDRNPLLPAQSDYPIQNRQMLHMGGVTYSLPPSDPRQQFRYNVWPGDSGTPNFLVLERELVLMGLVGAAELWGSANGWTPEARLNALIAEADRLAIAAGRLAAPTGYRVRLAPISILA